MEIKETFSLQINNDTEKAQVNMTGIVPKEKIESEKETVLKRLQKEKKIDGFREGSTPIDVVERAVGSLEVWRQSTHEVIMKYFPEIIAQEGLAPIGSPNLQLTAIPDNGDVSFQITFFTVPKVELPDYCSIVQKLELPTIQEEVSEEEVRDCITAIRKNLYKKDHPEEEVPANDADLPELTDEKIREISQHYTDKKMFTEGVRQSLLMEKKAQAKNEVQKKIVDAIMAETTIPIPEIIIEEDSKRAYDDFKKQAEHFGTTVEKYLEEQGMTEEQLQNQFKQEAGDRARIQLLLNAISAKEHIHADKATVEKEVVRFKERATDMTEEQIHTYIESLLTNEAVLQFLEKTARGAVNTPEAAK